MPTRLAGFKGGKYLIGQKAEINVAPFVDVMLVLLVVFTISGPIATVSLNTEARVGTPSPDAWRRAARPTYVSVTSGGAIYVTDQRTSLARLGADLTKRLNKPNAKDEAILIRADKRVRYGDFMAVVNQLQTDGYRDFTVINEDLSGES